MITDPWPHLVIDEFLPTDTYEELLENWPTEGWKELKHPDQQKPDGTFRRKQLLLEGELAREMTSPELQEVVFRRLDVDEKGFPFPFLTDDEPGYWIRPHPDTLAKIVTLQIYLPGDRSSPEMGTRLIGEFTSLVPFLPNSGYAFHPTKDTLHQVSECGSRRRSLMVIWYDREKPRISHLLPNLKLRANQ